LTPKGGKPGGVVKGVGTERGKPKKKSMMHLHKELKRGERERTKREIY